MVLMLLALLAACGEKKTADGPPSRAIPLVYTTFYPTTYFAERIGGKRIEVVCPLPDGEDPIFWMPDAEAIGAYQQADLIVVNGAGFEKWLDKVSLPEAKVVRTAAPFRAEWLTYAKAVEHSHGRGGKHAHEGIDGHTWLEPRLAQLQANEIRKAFARLLPEHEAEFVARYEELAKDLDALDAAFRALGRPKQRLAASHPAYNYLVRAYGWDVVNLDLDPEVPPEAPVQVVGVRYILWESEPTPEVAKAVGLEPIRFDPCETPGEGDYLDRMRANLERIRVAFE
jgi:zinc transport system substrate-binding protein